MTNNSLRWTIKLLNKKLCILSSHIPPDFAGAGKRALNQAQYIANLGHKMYLLTTTHNDNDIINLEIITISLPSFYKNNNLTGKLLRYTYHPALFFKLFKIINDKKINLLHCIPASSWFSLLSILAGKLRGAKVIAETTLAGSDDPVSINISRLGKLKLWMFNHSDAIVNISPLLASKCVEAGIPQEKIYIIPNGVDVNKFKPPSNEEKSALRKKLGTDQFSWVFIYVGIIRPRKNVKVIIEVFKQVKTEVENSCLILAGPTNKDQENYNYYCELKQYVENEKLGYSVFFTGEINNVEEWLKASDVFLFASNREGFGTVLVEAMSTGLPVVAMNIPKITDYIITHGENGFIVDNTDAFAKYIGKMVEDEIYYEKISNNARNTVLQRFSEEVVIKENLNLYKYLIM